MTEFDVGDDYDRDPLAMHRVYMPPNERDTLKMLMLNAIIAGALFNLMVFTVGIVEGSRWVALIAAASEGFAYLTAAIQVSAPRHPSAVALLGITVVLGLGAFGLAIHG